MTKLFTDEEFGNAKSRQLLPLRCKQCGAVFHRTKHFLQVSVRMQEKDKARIYCADFCSQKCLGMLRRDRVKCVCKNCGKEFFKVPNQKKENGNDFCNHSCSATYTNTHKTTGTRCSKLEKWLVVKLSERFPSLEFHFNRKDAINSELDIFVPSIKLAFELNGLFHYEPIFGEDKLKSIQNNDDRKFQACLEKGIELCILDTSKHKYFKESTCLPFLNIICDIINKKI